MARFAVISEENRRRYMKAIAPIGDFLTRTGMHPNTITFTGLLLSILSSLAYSTGTFILATLFVVLSGICDTLDGEIARNSNRSTDFGAFLDSSLDRYSDLVILGGIAWFFADGPHLWGNTPTCCNPWALLFTILSMIGSFMVSYTRARAGAIGVNCSIGLMQRPERMAILVVGSLTASVPFIGIYLMTATLFLIAIGSNVTAIHRIIYVRNIINERNRHP